MSVWHHTDFKFHRRITQLGCYWGGGGHTDVINSPWASVFSMWGVSPGKWWKSAMGMRRMPPPG